MMNKQSALEKRKALLKKMLERNLEKKSIVESVIRQQKNRLKETEITLEKMQATPIYLKHS